MLLGKNLVDRRVALLPEFRAVREGFDLGLGRPVGRVRPLASVYGQIAQKSVRDGAKGRDLDLDVRGSGRGSHRHFPSSFVRLALTKVAAWAGRASNGCGSLTIAPASPEAA